jgi:site-specific DNA recombinase
LQERLSELEHRLASVVRKIDNLNSRFADPGEVQQALEKFEPLWEHLTTWEQERFVRALVSEVKYDGRTETVTVGFRSSGIKELCSSAVPVTEEPTDERKQTRNPIQTSSVAGH